MTNLSKSLRFPVSLISATTLLIIFSCESEIKEVDKIDVKAKPSQISQNIEIIYSDSAMVKAKIFTKLLERYENIEGNYIIFPKGIKATFYNKDKQEETILTCKYAKYFESINKWIAKNQIVLLNKIENRKLETEELIYDDKEQKIYSNKDVKITTPTEEIRGKGFISNASFTSWKIKQVEGVISAKNNEF